MPRKCMLLTGAASVGSGYTERKKTATSKKKHRFLFFPFDLPHTIRNVPNPSFTTQKSKDRDLRKHTRNTRKERNKAQHTGELVNLPCALPHHHQQREGNAKPTTCHLYTLISPSHRLPLIPTPHLLQQQHKRRGGGGRGEKLSAALFIH